MMHDVNSGHLSQNFDYFGGFTKQEKRRPLFCYGNTGSSVGQALLGVVRPYVSVKMKIKFIFDRHTHDLRRERKIHQAYPCTVSLNQLSVVQLVRRSPKT